MIPDPEQVERFIVFYVLPVLAILTVLALVTMFQ